MSENNKRPSSATPSFEPDRKRNKENAHVDEYAPSSDDDNSSDTSMTDATNNPSPTKRVNHSGVKSEEAESFNEEANVSGVPRLSQDNPLAATSATTSTAATASATAETPAASINQSDAPKDAASEADERKVPTKKVTAANSYLVKSTITNLTMASVSHMKTKAMLVNQQMAANLIEMDVQEATAATINAKLKLVEAMERLLPQIPEEFRPAFFQQVLTSEGNAESTAKLAEREAIMTSVCDSS